MKIMVSICTSDADYSNKLVGYFNAHYYEKFQCNVYNDSSYLSNLYADNSIDILLYGEEYAEIIGDLKESGNCNALCVCISEDKDGNVEDIIYLNKYQRADEINRKLLDIYAEKGHVKYSSVSVIKGNTKFIAFVSAAGGVGTSSIACAAAKSYASSEKVLYINFEDFGISEMAFSDKPKRGMDEIIYAIKSRRNVLGLKIESSVSQDSSGVFYFKESSNPFDQKQLTKNDIVELLDSISSTKLFNTVILDFGNSIDEKAIAALSMVNRVVIITSLDLVADVKLKRFTDYIKAVEQNSSIDILSKAKIYYNKTLSGKVTTDRLFDIAIGGSFPVIENGDYFAIINRLSSLELFHSFK